jgi:2-dehydro-3-deoxyphosphogluconate aldolase/(4S)-4-hydroxy-2-oxoglutarate aldolase
MGSQLISKEILATKNYAKLTEDVKKALEIINKVR